MDKPNQIKLLLVYALSFLASFKFACGSKVGGFRNTSCIESEKQVLLLLKRNLVDEFNYLSTWKGDNCCAWRGIGCNNRTNHINKLDLRNGKLRGSDILPSLLDLQYLTYLDLSSNNFKNIQIPEFFGSFKELTYLNLSNSIFQGLVPHQLGNLSLLRHLDLNNNDLLSINSMGWLSGLSLLEHLDLSFLNLSRAIDWFPTINVLPTSFLVLKLHGCQLPNSMPRHLSFMNLTSLVSLDLGDNQLNSTFPLWVLNNPALSQLILGPNNFRGAIPKFLGSLTALFELDLSGNEFEGLVPESIGTLTSLTNLDLSGNNFQGLIPQSIGNLTSLSILDLSVNNFHGSLPESFGSLTSLHKLVLFGNNFYGSIPHSIGNLTSLSRLDLSINNFRGMIPESMGNLTSLSTIYLSENKLNGSIPPEMGNLTELTYLNIGTNEFRGSLPQAFCQLINLEMLYISYNQLSGSIPKCIGELSSLKELDLSSNSWEGFVLESHLSNLTELTDLSISSLSNLLLNISSDWVPPFQLEYLYMESLKVGPSFPPWLLTQRDIGYVIMPNTSISDTFPTDWFVSLPAFNIDISNNDIYGEQLSLISEAPNGLNTLALSNNRLSGEIPAFLCKLTSLETLVLSNNKFSGELPMCLGNLTELGYLDVMNNSLTGDIPVSLGFLANLNYLNLHNNRFQGNLPSSFQKLRRLVALDVGKNNLTDILHFWMEEPLPRLKYLILRSNNFHGHIPMQLCQSSLLQVLNLARNQITGNIPPCFGNFSAMITGGSNDPYRGFASQTGEMILDDAKGYELKYTSTLEFLFSIDLSNNQIHGEIPEELMDLNGLTNLNLAGNRLTERIPDTIGRLEKLEFLDLSRNELHGLIPQSLSYLDFLSHLNLSFNNLSGRIPTGNQLQTLNDPSIYTGNNQLCGQPILKPCSGDTESHNAQDSNESNSDSDERMWFYAGIGPGLLIGFLGFCASLHFITSWRYSYFQFVEQVFDRIAVAMCFSWRKFHN